MVVCIGTVRNKHNDILKYRMLDTDTSAVEDIDIGKIAEYTAIKVVTNLLVEGNSVECAQGQFSRYPIIGENNNCVKNNIPVVLSTSTGSITIANYAGKVVTFPVNEVLKQINEFANCFITSDRQVKFMGVQTKSNRNYLQEVLSFEGKDNIKLADVNIRGRLLKCGIRCPISFGATKAENSVPEDTSAYSFEIKRQDNKVELLKYIGDGYTGLVRIPDGVTHIHADVFSETGLTEIIMPDSVVYMGERCFARSKVKKVRLSKNITAIPLNCFSDSELVSINLENIKSIDNGAFMNSDIEEVVIKADIIQIGISAFHGCNKLSLFEHPGTIKKIRSNAFTTCKSLQYFDFSSVIAIEKEAFNGTGLRKVVLNKEVKYLQTSTIVGEIEEIELIDGFYKIEGGAASNMLNKPIKWTVPKSVVNIGNSVFNPTDTVVCYRKSVAASKALMAGCNIVYMDDDASKMPRKLAKAYMLNYSIDELLKDEVKKLLGEGSVDEIEYPIDESKLVRADIVPEVKEVISKAVWHGKYAEVADLKQEGTKFKAILEHLSKVSALNHLPLSSAMLKCKSTFRVEKIDTLYSDDKSGVYRVYYVDNKFSSITSSFILAKTYDTLRYVCMDNRYTNIKCEIAGVKDTSNLLDLLSPGDTLGSTCVIADKVYTNVYGLSDKEVSVKLHNNRTTSTRIYMNPYQALRYNSISVKLANNSFALILPANKKVLKCESLGSSVWVNEKEDTYKALQCTIDRIDDLETTDIFSDSDTKKQSDLGPLLSGINRLRTDRDIENYVKQYAHIGRAERSVYYEAGRYAKLKGITKLQEADSRFMRLLFETALIEERKPEWLDGSIGKTVVADINHKFVLSDGSVLKQYKTVKKTALRNKLMQGGDKKVYVFEYSSNYGKEVCMSTYDIEYLANACISMGDTDEKSEHTKIFEKSGIDCVVKERDIIEIAKLARGGSVGSYVPGEKRHIILAVYKPNGLYYIGIRGYRDNMEGEFVPIIMIGDLDVAFAFIQDTNNAGADTTPIRHLLSYVTIVDDNRYYKNRNTYERGKSDSVYVIYEMLVKARELCMNGVSDIEKYNALGLNETLKRCMGYLSDSAEPEEEYLASESEDYEEYEDEDDFLDSELGDYI